MDVCRMCIDWGDCHVTDFGDWDDWGDFGDWDGWGDFGDHSFNVGELITEFGIENLFVLDDMLALNSTEIQKLVLQELNSSFNK